MTTDFQEKDNDHEGLRSLIQNDLNKVKLKCTKNNPISVAF